MFSSRLYPLYVRAVSFQTCDRTFVQLLFLSGFKTDLQVRAWKLRFTILLLALTCKYCQSCVGRSAFPVQAPLEPILASE
ncbi:hypothetical protein AB432_026720 [Brevibacillus brevis]|uniref:Uncharacterized protein n=1 Tax=Brevibacillus brevis TaxID=1393 RepID=A0A2Z4MPG2_BREBE|nr:hypothetical protein AB432_026720 [Brevibacillus brevis]